MQTNTLDSLLAEANKIIKRLSFQESMEMINNTKTLIIDVREESELIQHGYIKNAINIPRGLIEFKLAPNYANNPINIDDNTTTAIVEITEYDIGKNIINKIAIKKNKGSILNNDF